VIRWFKLKGMGKNERGIDEAKNALACTKSKRREVDELVADLTERRRQNKFAPSLEAALAATRKR
jgi:hypothetical protein